LLSHYARGMVILEGTIRIGVGQRVAALAPMRNMIEATRAEPGCVAYSFAFDVLDEHLVRIFEVFHDEMALAEHRASAHMAAWRASWPSVGISDRDMTEYRVQSSRKI
jgi:quinol monooxygenase YgiN